MTTPTTCPSCGTNYAHESEQACAVALQGECINCMVQKQRFVHTDDIEALAIQRTNALEAGSLTRTFTVTVRCSKPIKDLSDLIGGRIWSMDKVEDVNVVEV